MFVYKHDFNRMEKGLLHKQIRDFFVRNFDVRQEKEDELETIESIKKGIEFKGTNLWVLIFATFVASLGLNTNSTAVIIGAMLISPLMGPIMGFGLGLGISDFDLIKRSFRNFATATVFSVITSTLFFLISPISEAQSELLARTQPTVYDVLIAFFGGLAGIVTPSVRPPRCGCRTGCCSSPRGWVRAIPAVCRRCRRRRRPNCTRGPRS